MESHGSDRERIADILLKRQFSSQLAFLNANPSSSSAASGKPHAPAARQSNAKPSPDKDPKPSLPFSDAQVAGIKRIRAMKAKGDLYGILGLEKGCAESDVKKAYRKLALQFHPDKCGAPGTDEAFKAISHSFTVLGDEGKREQYDRYGVDPESSRGSGGGGGNPFSRGGGMHPSFRGHQEVDPEELFNMFFGQMAGNGVHFQFGGNGARVNNRFQQQRRQQQRRQQTDGGIPNLFQYMPLIVLMLFSFISLFSGTSDPSLSEGAYSWEFDGSYTMKRRTIAQEVDYYVNPRMFVERYEKPQFAWRLKNFEKAVESQYYRNAFYQCQQEREYKQRLVSSAYSLFGGVDQTRLAQANQYDMKACRRVEEWNSRVGEAKEPKRGGAARKRANSV
ncbi:DnaJ domain-containing protein [Chytriomyces sp. MP71]|nr:DnaJ domain-containing protein [Chytriomyces sp. MP71]